MVLSTINPDVSYAELKTVYKTDKSTEKQMYELSVLDVNIIVALGTIRATLIKSNVSFFPIYMVTKSNSVMQIGVYEAETDKITYDEEGNPELSSLNVPLLHTFTTTKMLNKHRLIPEVNNSDQEQEQDQKSDSTTSKVTDSNTDPAPKSDTPSNSIPEIRQDIFLQTPHAIIQPPLKEETRQSALNVRQKYHETINDIWIQKYMKNKQYTILDNEGDGDCFFATIRDAFSSIGQETTVAKLRNKLANAVTIEMYSLYKEQYEMYGAELKSITTSTQKLKAEQDYLKQQMQSNIDSSKQSAIRVAAKRIKGEYDLIKIEHTNAKALMSEFKFMRGITSFDKFKNIIKTCEFWADAASIQIMETILNIKIIIFSSEMFSMGDLNNVLLCGSGDNTENDNSKDEDSVHQFVPEYYIIVDHTGGHYKLIRYKDHSIFKFGEIPFDIKKKISDKCMEKNAGMFSNIPDFTEFNAQYQSAPTVPAFASINESKLLNLYDHNITFMIHDRSADIPLPGKGIGEQILPETIKEYGILSKIPQWRKKLSDKFPAEIMTKDGKRWMSVEHYFQASKFKNGHPEYYHQFSLESGTPLSKSIEMAVSAGTSKTGKFENSIIRPSTVDYDDDFFAGRGKMTRTEGRSIKFEQLPEFTELLLATNRAKIIYYKRGKEPEIANDLMIIRDKLSRSKEDIDNS